MSEPTRENPLKLDGTGAPATAANGKLSDRVRSLRLPKQEKSQTGAGSFVPWILCLLLGGLAGYAAYQSFATAASVQKLQTNLVELVKNAKRDGDGSEAPPQGGIHGQPAGPGVPANAVVLASKGYVVPFSQIQVSPKVGGLLTFIDFKEGQRVAKGHILARVETDDYQADFDRAVATAQSSEQRYKEAKKGWREEEIAQVKAELDEAESQRDQLFLAYKRYTGLKGGGALAQQEFEQAQSQFTSMDRRVEKLRLNLKLYQMGTRDERIAGSLADWNQARADLAKAKWRLDNCTVRAPVAGVILTKKAEEGSQVNPAAFSNGLSASLCDMADLTNMEVDLSIAERDIARLAGFKRMKCVIKPDAFPERAYDGYISRIMPIADRAKGAVPVRVKIIIAKSEEGKYLRPDMSTIVSFLNAEWVDPSALMTASTVGLFGAPLEQRLLLATSTLTPDRTEWLLDLAAPTPAPRDQSKNDD